MARISLRATLFCAASTLAWSTVAYAHFNLSQPPNWTSEDATGGPQKDWPCGNEDSPPSNGPTTPFTAGQKITIQLTETITHAGHYRVALATSGNMMDLPQDMTRDASGATCQNDDMQATPMMPVLADGLLQHAQNQPLSGVQSIDVTLPSNVSCDKCVLQVREYMQGHSSAPETTTQTNGCYYHHCAFIAISAASGGAGGMSSSGGAPSAGTGSSAGGMLSMGGAAGVGATTSNGGMGGMLGQAGSLISLAGSTGSAGVFGVGGISSGGALGNGGTTTLSGGTGAGAGTGGSGGTSTGVAGTATSAGKSSGTGTPTEPAATSDDAAGGCTMTPGRTSWSAVLVGLLGLGLLRARRRR